MKLLAIDLPNRAGTFEIRSKMDVSKMTVMFQALANGLVFCESEFYDVLREVVLDAVSLNMPDKESMM